MSREIVDLWLDEMQKVMKEKHNAIILGSFTWPEQNFYCRGDVKSVEDLKGRKIRVQGVSSMQPSDPAIILRAVFALRDSRCAHPPAHLKAISAED
jgi:hypothetical protein